MNTLTMLRRWVVTLLALVPLCLAQGASAVTTNAFVDINPMSGLWWNPNESGWGVSVVQQFDVAFVTMFVYDASGNPTWYVASSCVTTSTGCSGTLYRTAGGQSPTVPWVGPITAIAVGSVTLSLSDPDTGTLSYMINGVSASKPIERQIWRDGPPPPTIVPYRFHDGPPPPTIVPYGPPQAGRDRRPVPDGPPPPTIVPYGPSGDR